MQMDNSILEEFKCPVCIEIMHPPIRICILGHSFCDRCAKSMRRCPTCREPKSAGRNYALEGIHDMLTLTCKYEGCKLPMLGSRIREHEEFCQYSVKQCPLKPVNNCTWKGQVQNMVAHCREHHPNNTFCSYQQKLICSQFLSQMQPCMRQPRLGESYCMLFEAYGKLFKCAWDINLQTGTMRWCVLLMGPRKEASKYYYKIQFENQNNVKEYIQLRSSCEPFYSPLFQEDKCMITHIEMVKMFCKLGNLHYTVSIHRKEDESQSAPSTNINEVPTSVDNTQSSSTVVPNLSRFNSFRDPVHDRTRQLLRFFQAIIEQHDESIIQN